MNKLSLVRAFCVLASKHLYRAQAAFVGQLPASYNTQAEHNNHIASQYYAAAVTVYEYWQK